MKKSLARGQMLGIRGAGAAVFVELFHLERLIVGAVFYFLHLVTVTSARSPVQGPIDSHLQATVMVCPQSLFTI
jgi:hypothetical protein